MKIAYKARAVDAIRNTPAAVRKAFFKQTKLLSKNPRHPSLRAKKFEETKGLWQARVNRDWRFYFKIQTDAYVISDLIPHPK
jgi:plasmid maintenance system killer protein